MWEIGVPDRSAAEFYVPDPNPNYVNRLYINHPDRSTEIALLKPILVSSFLAYSVLNGHR
jgi:hypothetical protein